MLRNLTDETARQWTHRNVIVTVTVPKGSKPMIISVAIEAGFPSDLALRQLRTCLEPGNPEANENFSLEMEPGSPTHTVSTDGTGTIVYLTRSGAFLGAPE